MAAGTEGRGRPLEGSLDGGQHPGLRAPSLWLLAGPSEAGSCVAYKQLQNV